MSQFTFSFCSTCGSTLRIITEDHNLKQICIRCPYQNKIFRPIRTGKKFMKLKEVDDIIGGAKQWENVDSTEEKCPKCSHPRAYFMQIQTRSADEPMTTFYKCCNHTCGFRWRE
ncbi:DNA-directed RNA polymerase III subunit RPC10 [Bemisia tabaci]|uniref:DNA-directed RNA polymerase III subunit RPC10 n=1 Tax=Bemisia tabaci TaxID=7038 RepID=UPI003B28C64F